MTNISKNICGIVLKNIVKASDILGKNVHSYFNKKEVTYDLYYKYYIKLVDLHEKHIIKNT